MEIGLGWQILLYDYCRIRKLFEFGEELGDRLYWD